MSLTNYVTASGHVLIKDDLNNVLLDVDNAIHPRNMARVIARALANENNFGIYRIAFGNGGTSTDASSAVIYRPPNDGQAPDTRTWDSRLYNEIYSEIVDEGNISLNTLLGTDPGSADPNVGTRPGGGASPINDPPSTPHVSGPGVRSLELGLTSQVVIQCVLNPTEPSGQLLADITSDGSFMFDELGLYSPGMPAADSAGYIEVDVGNKNSSSSTLLTDGTQYSFMINVDGGGDVEITFTVPHPNPTYGELCQAINTGDVTWNPSWGNLNPLPGGATVAITDNTQNYSTIAGVETYGFLKFVSPTVGTAASIVVKRGITGTDLFGALNPPIGASILTPQNGQNAGVQNAPTNPSIERERLLTHLVFTPILKAANRTFTITYTITVAVARTI